MLKFNQRLCNVRKVGKMFKKNLKYTIAFICVALVVVLAIVNSITVGASTHTVDCPDCGAIGIVLCECGADPTCEDCGGKISMTCSTCEGTCSVLAESNLYATFWSLVPPIIAILLALITKEVYSSLFIGILVGAFFNGNFNPVASWNAVVSNGFISAVADSWNAGIFIFLVILGIMVSLINSSGGASAFGRWAVKNIKTRVGACLASFVLGILIFIDDYFNCLTVGSVMTPVTDSHRVSRAKLAYIIDATAAPICMIAPISSWAAAVSSVASETGQNGIILFCRAIPYNFYSILTIVFVLALIILKLDYGPMQLRELNAIVNGDLGALDAERDVASDKRKGNVLDLLLPIIVLIIMCIVGMLYVGGMFDGLGKNIMEAFGDTDASLGLPFGSLIALIFTFIYLLARKNINFKNAMEAIPKGFISMVPAILILTFALTLKNVTSSLGADVFVAGAMESVADGLRNMFPAIIFLVACFLSFSTGTSWGTFGILIPIVTSIFAPDSTLFIIGISACLAGAVCGDHCSPISDTTIMASAGAKCDHVTHVSTQLPYTLTVATVSFVSYILAGIIQNVLIVLPIAILLMLGTIFAIKFITEKKSKEIK